MAKRDAGSFTIDAKGKTTLTKEPTRPPRDGTFGPREAKPRKAPQKDHEKAPQKTPKQPAAKQE